MVHHQIEPALNVRKKSQEGGRILPFFRQAVLLTPVDAAVLHIASSRRPAKVSIPRRLKSGAAGRLKARNVVEHVSKNSTACDGCL